jgi:DNA replication licensing factor MCM6
MATVSANSDYPSTPAGNATPRQRAFSRGSSARPRGPPTESLAGQSDDEGFADDQVPVNSNRPRNPLDRPVPRVEDKVGLVVQEHFEKFLESCVILKQHPKGFKHLAHKL